MYMDSRCMCRRAAGLLIRELRRCSQKVPILLLDCYKPMIYFFGSSGESVGSTTALDGNSDANETETTESTVRARLDSKSL